MLLRETPKDILKLTPLTILLIVPLCVIFIPPYLFLYHNAIPTRFVSPIRIEKVILQTCKRMVETQNNIRQLLFKQIDSLQGVSSDVANSLQIIKNWLINGFDQEKDVKEIQKIDSVFKDYVCPFIENDITILRELLPSIGITPITGFHYFTKFFDRFGIDIIFIPIIRSIYKFYIKKRLRSNLKAIDVHLSLR